MRRCNGDGADNWLTEDNDTAINFDCNNQTKAYMQYVYAGDSSYDRQIRRL